MTTGIQKIASIFTVLFLLLFLSPYALAESLNSTYDSYVSITGYDKDSRPIGFLYRDSMLLVDACEESTDIAKASVALADAAYGSSGDHVESLLTRMGYSYHPYLYSERSIWDNDHVAFVVGTKIIGDYIVYCVPVRGTASNSEWFSDFNLGENNNGNHEGFYKASAEVEQVLNGMFSSDGHSASTRILWFTGHSRGAAVANILAGEYSSSPYANASHVFGYTFACPSVSKNISSGQSNIYNYNNSGDLIPLLPLASWGYKRYGISKSIAATAQFNIGEQYTKFTGKPFASASGSTSYLGILNGLFPSEKAYYSFERQMVVYGLSYALGGKNDTSWDDFLEFLAQKGISETLIDFVNTQSSIGEVSHAQEVYDSIVRMQNFLESHDIDNMTDEEFDEFRSDNYDIFKSISDFVGFDIQDKAEYNSALATVPVYSADIERGFEAILWFQFFCQNESYPIDKAIYSGHEVITYISMINSCYFGYKGHEGSQLIEIVIDDNITSIGPECFAGCSSLTTVAGGSSINSIGAYAFSGCTVLSSTSLFQDNLQEIGEHAFAGCSSLTNLVLPDSVQKIGAFAFEGCPNLTNAVIPDSLQESGR